MMIPLMVGGFIYLTTRDNTYISEFFGRMGIVLCKINYPEFVRNYMCDLLWGYALCSGLMIFSDRNQKGISVRIGLISLTISVALETLQLISIVNATFDVIDIVAEATGILLSLLFIHFCLGGLGDEK